MPKKTSSELIPFTVLLEKEDMKRLQRLANQDGRQRAQMARLLLSRAIQDAENKIKNRP